MLMPLSEQYPGSRRLATNYADAETRGRLRQLKTDLFWHHRAVDRLYQHEFSAAAVEFCARGSTTGRQRVLSRLSRQLAWANAALEGVCLKGKAPLAIWAALRAREAVWLDERGTFGAVTVDYILAGLLDGEPKVADGLWTLEVSDHALGRAMQRAAEPLPALIMAAHRRLLRTRVDAVMPGFTFDSDRRFLVRAGSGGFVCSLRYSADVSLGFACCMHAYAHSWISSDMVHGADLIVPPDDTTGDLLGNSVLLPPPVRSFDGGRVCAWQPATAALALGGR